MNDALLGPRGGSRPHGWVARTGYRLLVVLLASAPTAVAGQADALPPAFDVMAGEWEGSGTLLGRPAAFRMAWIPLGGGFVRLSFANMWVGENGDTIPVLNAEATYRLDGEAALGVWLDDRPQQLTLSATVSDTGMVTDWIAPAERGRTEYVVTGPGQMVVRDYVIADGTPRLFAEGTYTRAGGR